MLRFRPSSDLSNCAQKCIDQHLRIWLIMANNSDGAATMFEVGKSYRYKYNEMSLEFEVLFVSERLTLIRFTDGVETTIRSNEFDQYDEIRKPQTATAWVNVYRRHDSGEIFISFQNHPTREKAFDCVSNSTLNVCIDTFEISYTEKV